MSGQKAVDVEEVVLDDDQKAVDINAVVLDGQVAISQDRVLPEGFKSVPEDALLLDPDQLRLITISRFYSLIKKQFLLIQLKASLIALVRSKIHLQLSINLVLELIRQEIVILRLSS